MLAAGWIGEDYHIASFQCSNTSKGLSMFHIYLITQVKMRRSKAVVQVKSENSPGRTLFEATCSDSKRTENSLFYKSLTNSLTIQL